jgi:hypothetical protein
MQDKYLYAGLIRLHVLHHAVKESIYGLAMIEELERHGYEISAGTLYPILNGLERIFDLDPRKDGQHRAPGLSGNACRTPGARRRKKQSEGVVWRTV